MIDVAFIQELSPELLRAAATTIWIWLLGCLFALLLGFVIALLLHFSWRPVRMALRLWVDVIRGTPFLIQLFLLYYGGPFIGLSLDPIPAGLLGLAVYGSAYFSEIFRAGLEAVPRGHIEAAEMLGLRRDTIVLRIMLPEMSLLVFPALVNMVLVMLKETAVLSVVTVPELTLLVSAMGSQYYAFAEALLLLALFYWGLVSLCSYLGRKAEAYLSRSMMSVS